MADMIEQSDAQTEEKQLENMTVRFGLKIAQIDDNLIRVGDAEGHEVSFKREMVNTDNPSSAVRGVKIAIMLPKGQVAASTDLSWQEIASLYHIHEKEMMWMYAFAQKYFQDKSKKLHDKKT